ncbi:MAG: hypothetical protein AAF797_06145 [Planctomycetota bacterium]
MTGTDPLQKPPPGSPLLSVMLLTAVLAGAMGGLFVLRTHISQPVFYPPPLVSPETTYFTGPLNPDGTIDYAAALNRIIMDGATPGNNAAIPLLRLIPDRQPWEDGEPRLDDKPIHEIFMDDRRAVFGVLGMDAESPRRQLTPFPDFDTYEAAYEALDRPWKPKEFPVVEAWLDENRWAWPVIDEALARPRLAYPYVNAPEPLAREVGTLRNPEGRFREVEYLIASDAFLAVHQQRWGRAIERHRQWMRLAELWGQQPTVHAQLIAIGIRARAYQLSRTLIADSSVPASVLSNVLETLKAVPGDQLLLAFRTDSRGRALQQLEDYRRGHLQSIRYVKGELIRASIRARGFDPARAQRIINGHFDALPAILPNHDALPEEDSWAGIEAIEAALPREFEVVGRSVWFPPDHSEAVGHAITRNALASVGAALRSHFQAAQNRELAIIAAALRLYQMKHSRFPETLDVLVPDLLDALPSDRFRPGGVPLTYRPSQDRQTYLLYSFGPNHADDKGTYSLNRGDLTIGFPMPADHGEW